MSYIDLKTKEYPISMYTLRERNPSVSIPINPNKEALASLGYAAVDRGSIPNVDTRVEIIGDPVPEYNEKDDIWQLVYSTTQLNADAIATNLVNAKSEKLKMLGSWIGSSIVGGFISSCAGYPVKFDSDTDTQITMQGIALNCNSEQFSIDYPNGVPIRGVAEGKTYKTMHPLTPPQILQFCADLSTHIGNCKLRGWSLQEQVALAKDFSELDAISW